MSAKLFVYGKHSINALQEELDLGNRFENVILQFDGEVPDKLQNDNIRLLSVDEVINAKEIDDIDQWCRSFVESWYWIYGEDITQYGKLSLGSIALGFSEIDQLNSIMQNYVCAYKVCQKIEPASIYLGEGVGINSQVWEKIATVRNIELVRLKRDKPIEVEEEWDPDIQFRKLVPRRVRSKKAYCLAAKNKIIRVISKNYKNRAKNKLDTNNDKSLLLICEKKYRADKELRKLDLNRDAITSKIHNFSAIDEHEYDKYDASIGRTAELTLKETMKDKWAVILDNYLQEEKLKYKDDSLVPYLKNFLFDLLVNKIPLVGRWTATSHALLRTVNPDVVLTKVTWGDEKQAFCRVAQALGLPVIGIQREYFATDRIALGKPSVDNILTVGKTSNDFFAKRQIPITNLYVAGEFRNRSLVEYISQYDKKKTRNALGLGNKPIILLADSRWQGSTASDLPIIGVKNLRYFKEAARVVPEAIFAVKFHPGNKHLEGRDHVQQRVNLINDQKPSNLVIAPLNSMGYDWLAVASLVVCDNSTMAYEAMMLNKPVIYLRTSDNGLGIKNFESPVRAAFGVRDEDDLHQIIKKILKDYNGCRRELADGQKRYLQGIFGTPVPALDVIEDIVKMVCPKGMVK